MMRRAFCAAALCTAAAVLAPFAALADQRFEARLVGHAILPAREIVLAPPPDAPDYFRISGRFTGHRSGHALNNRLLRALFADRGAWRLVEGDLPADGMTTRLPAAAAPAVA